MAKCKCKSCDENFDTANSTIEMSGVPDDLWDEAFDLVEEGEICAECIVTNLAYQDSMQDLD